MPHQPPQWLRHQQTGQHLSTVLRTLCENREAVTQRPGTRSRCKPARTCKPFHHPRPQASGSRGGSKRYCREAKLCEVWIPACPGIAWHPVPPASLPTSFYYTHWRPEPLLPKGQNFPLRPLILKAEDQGVGGTASPLKIPIPNSIPTHENIILWINSGNRKGTGTDCMHR